jgi:hypothetical protein
VSLGVTTKSQEAVSRLQADSPSLAVWPGLPRYDSPKGDVGLYPFTVKDACISSPSGLRTYHGPPSWSMPWPVTMPGFTSRM